jgi:fructokinase
MLLCCGDALIDMIPARTGDSRDCYVPAIGGSCCNIAVALGRLGAEVGFMGGIAKDFFGDFLVQGLAASNVSTRYVARLDHETTLGFVKLGDGEPQYAFYDETTAARMWRRSDSLPLGREVRLIHIGSVTLIAPPVADECLALFEAEKGRRLLSVDPNCRPTLTRDVVGYRQRLQRIFALADIIRLSRSDLAFLLPETPGETAATAWLAAGASLVVLTEGAAGATAWWPGGGVHVAAAEAAVVVDTIGAGDSFLAALLVQLDETGKLSRKGLPRLTAPEVLAALAYAATAAALTCTRSGANSPWRHELPRPLPEPA